MKHLLQMNGFLFIMFVICCLPLSYAAAAVPAAAVGLGGLSPYATTDYVKSVYGAPGYETRIESGEIIYAYGNTTLIYFTTERRLNGVVKGTNEGSDDLLLLRRIDTQKGSGLSTPAGVGVGDTEQKVREIYGKPDVQVIAAEDYDSRMMYVGERSNKDESICFMTFFVKDGRVVKISCYATRH